MYVLRALGRSVFVRWCCGSAVGMAIRITSISVTLHFEGTQEFHKLYTNGSASGWQDFFGLELGTAAR